MSERKEKSPEQVSDEDYKVAPTSADQDIMQTESATTARATKHLTTATRPDFSLSDASVREELEEGVE